MATLHHRVLKRVQVGQIIAQHPWLQAAGKQRIDIATGLRQLSQALPHRPLVGAANGGQALPHLGGDGAGTGRAGQINPAQAGLLAITAKKGSPLAPTSPANPAARVVSAITVGGGQPWAINTSAT